MVKDGTLIFSFVMFKTYCSQVIWRINYQHLRRYIFWTNSTHFLNLSWMILYFAYWHHCDMEWDVLISSPEWWDYNIVTDIELISFEKWYQQARSYFFLLPKNINLNLKSNVKCSCHTPNRRKFVCEERLCHWLVIITED